MSCIYKITCTANCKIYVGSTKRDPCKRRHEHFERLAKKRHSNPIMTSAWNLYGPSSFIFEVIEECHDDVLLARENHYIELFGSMAPLGFNCQTAVNPKMSDDTKRRMSEAKLGELNHFYGKTHSDESRMKMSKSLTGKALSCDHVAAIREGMTGAKNPFFGRRHTAESRAKMSESLKGKTLTAEHRDSISRGNRGKTIPQETREKMSVAARGRVMSLETREKLSIIARERSKLTNVSSVEFDQNISEPTPEQLD